ncbi:hypothetical protein ACFQZ2_05375 [Streptomonospora algeriensis]|uniref:Uncharacterized protein n=1 Tax=Streptomonospora algeriensis TaxID=995084 RepID=A0ABW3BCC6_9ACTN
MTDLPPHITADTWDPVGVLAEHYRHTWTIRGGLVLGGDWHWRLERLRPVPPGAAAYGVETVWEGYARPQEVARWLDRQATAWRWWQQQAPHHHRP